MTPVAGEAAEAAREGARLYLISPSAPDAAPDAALDASVFGPALEAALSVGGIAAFLLRGRHDRDSAGLLRAICAGRTAFLVEDDLALAQEIGADGVHLSAPAGVRDTRARLGPDRILGASCGGSRHAAMLAGEDGADYIAFGEAGREPRPPLLELVAWWAELFVLPSLIEGRFDRAGCVAAARAGADFIGVSEAVWRHPDGAAAGVRSIQDAIADG